MKRLFYSLLLALLAPAALDAQTIVTIAGNGTNANTGDNGPATSATISQAGGIAIDRRGSLYVALPNAHIVRKVDTSGIITTFAGNGIAGASGDNGPATTATINFPACVAADLHGNIYIADCYANNIRKVDTNGIITTIAGTGLSPYNGDGIPATAANIFYPIGVHVDSIGEILIGERDNFRVRKVDTFGIIHTIAGTGIAGYTGDGFPATDVKIVPNMVTMDRHGNVYIGEAYNHSTRKINTSGIISTIAGGLGAGFSGDGGPATAAMQYGPNQLEVDARGNIYIEEITSNRVRKIDTGGIRTTVAGTGPVGTGSGSYGGDGGPATAANLNSPWGLALDAHGNIYISDWMNYRIRKVIMPIVFDSVSLGTNTVSSGGGIVVYPNPSTGTFVVSASGDIAAETNIVMTDALGRELKTFTLAPGTEKLVHISLPPGTYFLTGNSGEGKWTKAIQIWGGE